MLRVYGCIVDHHDLRLVLLAGLICLFACYTAVGLLAHARQASPRKSFTWLSAAAVVFGAGVWATHFVAELAFSPGLPAAYDIGLTALSILPAVVISWAGMMVWRHYRHAWLGGGLVGAAVGAMHYTGMAALRVPADVNWDLGYVAASVAIGMVLAAGALRVAARGSSACYQISAALLLVLAVCGLHFTAMAAVSFVPDPLIVVSGAILDPDWMAIAVAAITVLIVALGLIGSAVDRRLAARAIDEAERLRSHIVELEATKRQLEATARDLESALSEAAAASQAKSQFLGAMSHELRTPLNAVIGFSELIVAESFGPLGNEHYKNYAGCILDSGKHLLDLINDILDFTKLDANHLDLEEDEIDLLGAARDAMRMVQVQAAKAGVQLSEHFNSGVPVLRADRRRVVQVILNLLSNAVKFTPKGGAVRVTAFLSETGISVAVADTGIGIAADDIPKALERFGQVDSTLGRKFEGTGLGLPLSKRLMELHGGTLEIDSVVGAGTTVTIGFPAYRILENRAVA